MDETTVVVEVYVLEARVRCSCHEGDWREVRRWTDPVSWLTPWEEFNRLALENWRTWYRLRYEETTTVTRGRVLGELRSENDDSEALA